MDPLTGATADLCSVLDARQLLEFLGHTTTAVVIKNKNSSRIGKIAFGAFDDFNTLCREIQPHNGKSDIYVAQNIVDPDVRGRANNRLQPYATTTVGEGDFHRRGTLFIDCDPNRLKGINSTDEELAAGKEVADSIRAFLLDQWGVEPLVVMSGNGWHLYYAINEPTESPLPAAVLKYLKAKFETPRVTVDASTSDVPQLVRLPGTLNVKGDPIEGRPQRLSYVHTSPDERVVVTTEQLASLTLPAPTIAATTQRRGEWTDRKFRGMLDSSGTEYRIEQKTHPRYDNGIAYRVRHCPNHEHRQENEWRAEFWLNQDVPSFNCPSDQCSGVNKVTAGQMIAKLTGERESAAFDPLRFSLFRKQHAGDERRTIVEGFLRERDVGMAVGGTKTHKTFHAMQLSISVAAGIPFLGRYATTPGRVLYADYELFPNDIVKRVETMQRALGVSDAALENLEYVSMRGLDATAMDQVCDWLDTEIAPGTYALVIFDAIYRAYPDGFEENSNPHYTRLISRLDKTSKRQGNAFLLVHHTSKGNQANKKNTDIGSGAGAQSRAVDCHLTLVEHSPGKVLMRASLRSFAPLDPVVLKFDYPIWSIDDGADPNLASGNALMGVDDIVALLASEKPKKDFIREASNMLKAKGFYAPMTDVARIVELAIEEGRIVEVDRAKGKKYIAPAEGTK
ncbi:AAA family ATPase [Lacipirellula sp.]|uniref:AAA family ATPase n=1 Tax=Lacipirellula sp. TaxID=2691419 RepID=UPI003D11FF50